MHKLVSEVTGPVRKEKHKQQNVPLNSSWTEIHEKAFEELTVILTSTPVLGFPDFKETFVLETDASLNGLGLVLSQRHNGTDKVIAYASRGLRVPRKIMWDTAPRNWNYWLSGGHLLRSLEIIWKEEHLWCTLTTTH